MILVAGGSQGSVSINNAVVDAVPLINDDSLYIIHICGPKDYLRIEGKTRHFNNYRLLSYSGNITDELVSSDLVVCRAGATMLSEITALAKPSVIIPYPYAANKHQDVNAMLFFKKGASKVIPDSSLSGKVLSDIIKELMGNGEELLTMSLAAKKMAKIDAAKRIEDILYEAV